MSERLRSIPPEYQNLRFIGPRFDKRDLLDQALDILLPLPFRVETAKSEENIPPEGPLVFAFAPHCGWVEAFVLDHHISKRRPPPVWLGKIENLENVPSPVLGHRKYIFVTRERPEKSVIAAILQILGNPKGSIVSAFEGTRKGNPQDPNDFLTLSEAKTGLVYFATKARAPISPVVILGAEQFLPCPEDLKAERGTVNLIWEEAKAIFAGNKPLLQIRFAPPYTGHILPEGVSLHGHELKEHLQQHTDIIMREIIIPQILEIRPDYPLGPYEDVKSQ